MAYRTAAKPAQLTIRPDPIRRSLSLGVFTLVALMFGVPSLLFGKTEGTDDRSVAIIFGSIFTVAGAVTGWFAYAAAATRVHLSVDGDHLDIRWTRFRKEVRHERVPTESLVDVGVHDTPMSGPDHHDVVIGTLNGDIALSRGHAGALRHFIRKRDEVAAFLALPMRPRDE